MILRMFPSPLWLFLLRILLWYFETIPSVHTYSNKSPPKNYRDFYTTVTFQRAIDFEQWVAKWAIKHISDMHPSPQCGTSRKKIVCLKKVFEIDRAENSLWISSTSYIIWRYRGILSLKIPPKKMMKFICFKVHLLLKSYKINRKI